MKFKKHLGAIQASYSLASPFRDPDWPMISTENQQAILELLCSLLEPLGAQNRSRPPSKGKRRKRKRQADRKPGLEEEGAKQRSKPTPLASNVLLGFNSTQRYLQGLAQTAPSIQPSTTLPDAVFADRSVQSSRLYQNLPLTVAAASANSQADPPVRLVALPTGASARLAKILCVPRVTILCIKAEERDAAELLESVLDMVAPVEAPWLNAVNDGLYLPAQIDLIEIPAAGVTSSMKPSAASKISPEVESSKR